MEDEKRDRSAMPSKNSRKKSGSKDDLDVDDFGPPLWMKIWLGKAVRGIMLAGLLALFYAGLFGKAEFSGWGEFFRFFTNLSWTIEAVFYTAVTLGILFHPLRHVAILILFVPVLNLALFVWIMLQIVVASNPLLLDELKEMSDRLMIIGNEYYHTVPVFVIFGFTILTYSGTLGILRYVWNRPGIPWFIHLLNALWQIYFPLILAGFYCIANDPMEVYGIVHMSVFEVVAIAFLVNTIVGGLVFLFCFPYTANHLWFRIKDITEF